MAEVYVFMTDGTEECEALVMVDLLRRGGIDVKTVAVPAGEKDAHHRRVIHSLHNVPITCDLELKEVPAEEEAVFFVPGGKTGVENLRASDALRRLLENHRARDRQFVGVCAGPSVLGSFGLVKGKNVAVYPGYQKYLEGANYDPAPLVEDDQLLTGRALGASMRLAFRLIEKLRDGATAENVKHQIYYDGE